ncbi:MAG: hypothetical protein GY853_01765 [PVC group bacterium]|nr:hypothetical protein [PVC group bacterium]
MSYLELRGKVEQNKQPICHDSVFIAIYTNKCKEYCDQRFFSNLFSSNLNHASVNVVDNSSDIEYTKKLEKICEDKANVYRIDIDEKRKDVRFLRNVTESVLLLREKFLEGNWKYFIILESDVLPKDNEWLTSFMEVTDEADIIGGLYYMGFHDPGLWQGEIRVVPTHHVLSGCTLYKREVIEKYPFRWSEENLGAFPDAYICFDAGNEYRLANYTKIVCDHLEKSQGDRGHGRIS